MLNRLETRKKIADEALTREFLVGEERWSYGSIRDALISFLAETAGDETGMVVGYQRQVTTKGQDQAFRLTVDTRKDEQGGYGERAKYLFLAIIHVTLEGEDGGRETTEVYPLRWFLEHDPMYLSIEVKKTVDDLAEIVGILRRGDYLSD